MSSNPLFLRFALSIFVANQSIKQGEKLPLILGDNIKCGNSIIHGSRKELKKFVRNPSEKRPFNWEQEFSSIFAAGGFDIAIGNPPYYSMEAKGAKHDEEQNYFRNIRPDLYQGKNDVYYYFIAKGIDLLKN